MKKNAVLCLVLFALFLSCKKSNSGSPSYHITATVGGTAKTFNTAMVATRDTLAGVVFITISGVASTSTGEQISLVLYNPGGAKIVPGTYYDTTADFAIECTYSASIGVTYIGSSGMAVMATGAGVTIAHHVKLVITAMDSQSIQGTFSGDCYANGDVSAAIKTVTSGDFNLKFQ